MIACERRTAGTDALTNVLVGLGLLEEAAEVMRCLDDLRAGGAVKGRFHAPALHGGLWLEVNRPRHEVLHCEKLLTQQKAGRDELFAIAGEAVRAFVAGEIGGGISAEFQPEKIAHGVAILHAVQPPQHRLTLCGSFPGMVADEA